MFENKQKYYVLTMLSMVVLVSISQNAKDNANVPFAPVSEVSDEGFLPNPFMCVRDIRKVSNCISAVKKFQFNIITKEYCLVLLSVSEDCLGMLFPMRFAMKNMFKLTCKLIGIHD